MRLEPKSTRSIRKAAIRAVWESCGKPGKLSMWIDRFLGWDIYPVEVDGALVGAVLAHGPEVHVGVLPEYHGKWLRPWLWRAVFVERASRYGYLLTQVAKGRPDDFVRRCGFEPTYTDGDRTFYVRQCDV